MATSKRAPASTSKQTDGEDQREAEGFSTLQALQISLISWVAWVAVWLVSWTVRFRVVGDDAYESLKASGNPIILTFWHNQIFPATYFFRFRRIVVITSRHFDGEYIARVIEKFGYGTARGSSTRGAVRALLEMKKHLLAGRDVAFTIDGPRGPVYRVKPGPVWLSQKTGLPVLAFHIEPRSYWELNSWDRFRIPKPFTSAVVRYAEPLIFDKGEDESQAVARFQAEMDRIRREAALNWGRPD